MRRQRRRRKKSGSISKNLIRLYEDKVINLKTQFRKQEVILIIVSKFILTGEAEERDRRVLQEKNRVA